MGQGSETINGYRWLNTLLSAADPAWRSQQLLEAIDLHLTRCWTLKSHRQFRRRPTPPSGHSHARRHACGLIAHAWLSVICGGTSGRRCRWIRRVDGLDCDMPMRFLRPFAKWSHDGSGRSSRDRSWQSDPEICPQIRSLVFCLFLRTSTS